MSHSRPRQNYHADSEEAVNHQINMELYASYVYLSMSFYFDRDDVALPGLRDCFKKRSEEEHEHAEKLMSYQNKRGGRIILHPIEKPDTNDWGTVLNIMETSLDLEKKVNQSLLRLRKIAEEHDDAEMTDFIEGEFLHEQVNDIKELSDHITNLHRVGGGLGEYIFDKHMKS